MIRSGTAALLAALVLFAAYFGNVAMGAAGLGAPLGDVPEMLTLLAAAIAFVAGVLAREATAAQSKNIEPSREDTA
ncbi:MAG: hypothetical protein AAGC57_15625 [Pseudomonadota bacterium]